MPFRTLVFETSAYASSATPAVRSFIVEMKVELEGIEPSTSCMPCKHSPS